MRWRAFIIAFLYYKLREGERARETLESDLGEIFLTNVIATQSGISFKMSTYKAHLIGQSQFVKNFFYLREMCFSSIGDDQLIFQLLMLVVIIVVAVVAAGADFNHRYYTLADNSF